MFLSFFLPLLVSSCGDVCNEDDGAYIPDTYPNVPPASACPSGYTTFLRPGYKWCIQIFAAGNYSYAEAEALCEADGAVVSGFQNSIERNWIASKALVLILNTYGVRQGSIWIGLQLREACDVDDWYSVAACTPTTTAAYYWTDGYTTGYNQIVWQDDEPADEPYNCTFMVTYDRGNVSYTTVNPQEVQNYDCTVTDPEYPYMYIGAVVCGKLQTVYD